MNKYLKILLLQIAILDIQLVEKNVQIFTPVTSIVALVVKNVPKIGDANTVYVINGAA